MREVKNPIRKVHDFSSNKHYEDIEIMVLLLDEHTGSQHLQG